MKDFTLITEDGVTLQARHWLPSRTSDTAVVLDGRILAKLHAIDWKAAGFDFLVPPGDTPGVLAQLEPQPRACPLLESKHPLQQHSTSSSSCSLLLLLLLLF